jgi:ParB family chromosome partitioning protein
VEQAAKDADLRIYPRLKDTRQALLDHYREERFIPPIARFTPNEAELDEITNLGTSEEDPAEDVNLGNRDDGREEVTAEPEPSDDNGALQTD